MKSTLLIMGCLAATLVSVQAQAPRTISDFEGADGTLYWNSIGTGVKLEIVDNPLKDDVNGSDKVLKMTLPKSERYAGAIISVEDLLVGDAEGHYRYGKVKFFKPQEGVSIFKLQKGPNDISREVSKTVSAGAWMNESFDFNFTEMGDPEAIGSYGEVFVIGNTTDYDAEEFVMYIDDVMFTNERPTIHDGLPEPTDVMAMLDNFENGKLNFTDVLNPMEGASFQVVDNPKKDAVNGSEKVLEVLRPEGKPAWIGFYAKLNANAAPKCNMDKYRYARMKVLQDIEGASASFKLENPLNGTSIEKGPVKGASKVNEWEELIFDLGEATGLYPQVVIMPDYADNRSAHSVYIDDILFSKEMDTPVASLDLLSMLKSMRVVADGNCVDVMFQAACNDVMNVSIYDAAGKTVVNRWVEVKAGENRVLLNVDGSGIFLVKVSKGNKGIVSKFCK